MADHVTEPIPGPQAFASSGTAAEQSQAAILLAMGMQLRGDPASLRVRAEVTRDVPEMRVFSGEDLERFPLPPLSSATTRFTRTDLLRRMPAALSYTTRTAAPETARGLDPAARAARADLAEGVYRTGSPELAAALFEGSLSAPEPLVRVAAAASYLELSTDPRNLIGILTEGVASDDRLVHDVAATALARVAPTHPSLAPPAEDLLPTVANAGSTAGPPQSDALLVHGTWAQSYAWWQPGGDFHSYLRGLRPGLYAAPDRFDWSGGYSDAARLIAAEDLREWVARHQMDGLQLFTHSHGGSVSMLASQAGMNSAAMVLLSCPVHADKYYPDFGHVKRVVSIRVRMDLVILADRGGQRFRDSRIEENVLPVWFNHSASHEPDIWSRHNVPRMI